MADGLVGPRLPLPFSVLDWLRSDPSSAFPPATASPPFAGRAVPRARPSHEPGDEGPQEDTGPGPLRPPAPTRPDVHGHIGQRPDPGRQMYGPRASAGPYGGPSDLGGGAGAAPSLVPSGPTSGAASPESSQTAGGQGDGQSTSSRTPGRPVMLVLPLGAGMLLVGLGLGFLGLRLRRR